MELGLFQRVAMAAVVVSVSTGVPPASASESASSTSASVVPTLKDLFDVDQLARPRRYRSLLASSYDRRGGNFDYGNYERTEGTEGVVLDTPGPGMIVRIWTAKPQGTIRVYLDRESRPALEERFEAFFAKLSDADDHAGTVSDAKNDSPHPYVAYCAIPFEKHCKITLSPAVPIYYQFNYLRFDEPVRLPRFSAKELSAVQRQVAEAKKGLTWDDTAGPPSCRHVTGRVSLAPMEKALVFDEIGPLVIRRMSFSVPWPKDAHAAQFAKRNLLLRGRWDHDLRIAGLPNRQLASLQSPLAYFFLDFSGFDEYRSALIAKSPRGYSCRFPMPARLEAALELVNLSPFPIGEIAYDIAYEPLKAWDAALLHFKAAYHGEESTFGRNLTGGPKDVVYLANEDRADDFKLLQTWGEGHFVGACFFIDFAETPVPYGIIQADEAVFVDDKPQNTLWGTGLEDYLDDAWGIRRRAGLLAGGRSARNTLFGYRFHLPDAIPYKRGVRFMLEHGSGNSASVNLQSVAYYYQKDSGPHNYVEGTPSIPEPKKYRK